jgi:hypothetical protein
MRKMAQRRVQPTAAIFFSCQVRQMVEVRLAKWELVQLRHWQISMSVGALRYPMGDKLAMTPMSGCSAITRVPRSFRFATSSDVDTGKTILRDYIKATVGFDKLSQATKTPSKSLIRMFGPNGNPQAKNLFNVPGYLQKQAGIELRVIFD